MTNSNARVEVDAVNWCHSPVLYQSQLALAQWRCNVNRTTELVIHVDENQQIIEQRVITADRDLPIIAINDWRKS